MLQRGDTPLAVAANNGNEAVMRVLLEAGVEKNPRDTVREKELFRDLETTNAFFSILARGVDVQWMQMACIGQDGV